MPGSTYSSNLKIELMTTGENSGTWGDVTNTNLGTALEQAIIGYGNPDYTSDANLTITITNSNASQAARCLVLNVTSVFGALTATRELIVPTSQKQYIVQNNTTGGQSITVKTSAGTGITVPNGRKAHLYVNGTDVVQMFDFVDINGGAIDGTTIGAASASTGAFTTLSATGDLTLSGTVGGVVSNANNKRVVIAGGTSGGTTTGAYAIFEGYDYGGAGAGGAIAIVSAAGTTNPISMVVGATTRGVFSSTGLAVTGTLSATGNVTLSGGTENGVAYLNGSKVLTTGSALSFDGSKLLVSSSGEQFKLLSSGDFTSTGSGYIRWYDSVGSKGYLGYIGTANTMQLSTGGSGFNLNLQATGSIIFEASAAERMRLTSTGLGIGNTSPASYNAAADNLVIGTSGSNGLTIVSGTTNDGSIHFADGTSGADAYRGQIFYSHAANYMVFSTDATERMRIDSSGNVGIGTSSPGARLQVNTGAAGTVGQIILMAASQTADALRVTRSDTNLSLQFTPTGQLSIGDIAAGASTVITTGPSTSTNANLKVSGSNVGNPNLFLQSFQGGGGGIAGPTSFVYFGDANRALSYIGGTKVNAFASNASSDLVFGTTPDISTTAVTERMRLDSSGNLGIGTSSPSVTLSVAGTIGVFGGSLNGSIGSPQLYRPVSDTLAIATGAVERMRIDSSGNLGIGTTSPVARLHVTTSAANATGTMRVVNTSSSSSAYSGFYLGNDTSETDALMLLNSSTNTAYGGARSLLIGTNSSSPVVFITGATERMRIDSSGNLLLGGTLSNARLTVGTSDATAVIASGGSNTFLTLGAMGADGAIIFKAGGVANGNIGTERARIDSSGNLLVGATSPYLSEKFNVTQSANQKASVLFNTNASFTNNVLNLRASRNTSNSTYGFLQCSRDGVADVLYIQDSGNVINTNNSYGQISDIKLKENIVDSTPKLEKLNQVRVVNFNFIGDQQKQLGVIAQELEQVFPGMIDESPDRDAKGNDLGTVTKSVKYSVFVPMLIKAMQELKAEFDAYKASHP